MNRPRLLQHVLRDCYCRLRPSKIDGIGVFAIKNIPSGVNPFMTIAKYSRHGYVRITEDELDGLPSGISRLLRALFVPSEGKMYVPTCGTNVIYLNAYLNHSTRPNMRTKDGYTFTTRRMIRTGEELTADYRTYGAEAVLKAPVRVKS
jgi:hypothetical protein